MASFFDKLKKGMGIEVPPEENEKREKKPARKKKVLRAEENRSGPEQIKKMELETRPAKEGPEVEPADHQPAKPPSRQGPEPKEEMEIEEAKVPVEKEEEKKPSLTEAPKGKTELARPEESKERWPEPEGQLAVDVYQTETELVIQSAIAGVKPEDLDISLERDILSVKGVRQKPFEEKGDYFSQECYWGPFSREVILPVEVDPDRAEATMKDGILTIRILKLLREKRRRIKVRI